MERPFASVTVTEKAARALRGGHPWVFAGEVLTKESPCPDGEIVDVYTEKGRWQGAGFYNGRSLIRVRILSRNTNDKMDEAFFRRRIRYALAYRQQVMGEDFAACRLIFGGRLPRLDGGPLRRRARERGALARHRAAARDALCAAARGACGARRERIVHL